MELYLSIIACVISFVSLAVTLYTFRWTAGRDRKQATLEAYNQLQAQALDHINLYKLSQVREIARDCHSEEFKTLSTYVARIEHFCVGVNQGIYDSEVVYELAHGYFDGSLKNRIEPIIQRKNQYGEDYYANIHKVYAKMDAQTEAKKRRQARGE